MICPGRDAERAADARLRVAVQNAASRGGCRANRRGVQRVKTMGDASELHRCDRAQKLLLPPCLKEWLPSAIGRVRA